MPTLLSRTQSSDKLSAKRLPVNSANSRMRLDSGASSLQSRGAYFGSSRDRCCCVLSPHLFTMTAQCHHCRVLSAQCYRPRPKSFLISFPTAEINPPKPRNGGVGGPGRLPPEPPPLPACAYPLALTSPCALYMVSVAVLCRSSSASFTCSCPFFLYCWTWWSVRRAKRWKVLLLARPLMRTSCWCTHVYMRRQE